MKQLKKLTKMFRKLKNKMKNNGKFVKNEDKMKKI